MPLASAAAEGFDWLSHNSRLLATGGGSQLEGQAGGGIVPWAVLAGYGSSDEVAATGFYTHVELDDYALDAYGVAVSFDNRVELSLARQEFDLGTLGDALGLDDKSLRQNIVGAKVRLAGDLVYGRLPQLAVGLQVKSNLDFGIPSAVGARRRHDTDFYLSATKLWLAGLFDRNVFANATLRYSRANQGGLLGFGGDRDDSRDVLFEGSAGVFVNRYLALGFEYRQQPDNLGFSDQDDWFDVFVGVFPNKHVSIVAAYADLGTVATLEGQKGWYLSLELAY
ncbi:MAG: DUF3034 family protein [Gammaproteobacteria bacterium]|nr:DUF3034 family protein [Planctomycetota bacterium]MCP5199493.1 DUF3034 family protein [Gammaproteobacteria bacterium]